MEKERYTNVMGISLDSKGSIYHYQKSTIRNCKVTFVDGSSYWQKMITDDTFFSIKSEPDKLYLDEQCTILAVVTRKQKIQECKRMGLI